MQESSLYTYVAVALVVVVIYRWRFGKLYDIPTIGPSIPILSYLGTYRYLRDNKALIQEGYEKFKGGIFKVAMLDRWLVIISGRKAINEISKLSDDQASFIRGQEEFVQFHHSFGSEVMNEPFHIELIREQLTRHISTTFDDLRDEIVLSFDDLIPATSAWTPIYTLRTVQTIIARVSSRMFVGLPLCHDAEYLKLSVNHTAAVARVRDILSYFPGILKPLAGAFLHEGKHGIQEGKAHLSPLIQERLDDMKQFGEVWSEKPNDMLQWVIDLAVSKGKSLDSIVRYMMLINFAAIHTSSNSLTHSLYNLAAHPEYLELLRAEVDSIISAEGWTKAAMQKLRKVDSFIRESIRMNGIDGLSLVRKAMKDITLSNGVFIPADTVFVTAAMPTHMDSENYTDPTVFNPWRFSDLRDKDGESNRHQLVSTSVDFVPFGHGKHACPGRFFAANEIKAIFAHIVMNYDVKFENNGLRPENLWLGSAITPNPSAKVHFYGMSNGQAC